MNSELLLKLRLRNRVASSELGFTRPDFSLLCLGQLTVILPEAHDRQQTHRLPFVQRFNKPV